jgi:hypothetical protein
MTDIMYEMPSHPSPHYEVTLEFCKAQIAKADMLKLSATA